MAIKILFAFLISLIVVPHCYFWIEERRKSARNRAIEAYLEADGDLIMWCSHNLRSPIDPDLPEEGKQLLEKRDAALLALKKVSRGSNTHGLQCP